MHLLNKKDINLAMKKMKIIILLSFMTCLISCKKEEGKKIEIKEIKNNGFSIEFDFPDTVYVNQSYNGRINYKNVLDTVTTSLNDPKKYRFIDYGFTVTKDINYDVEHLKKIETDTFTSETNRIIPLYYIRFNKPGIRYIDGIITDEVSIENGGKNEKGEPMTRVITYEFRATHKVVVLEGKEKQIK
jgi:hypothetical protein